MTSDLFDDFPMSNGIRKLVTVVNHIAGQGTPHQNAPDPPREEKYVISYSKV